MWISQPYTTAPTDASCNVVTAAFALLDELHIPYTRVDHDTADTMEDCAAISDVLGNRCKTKVNEEEARITLTLPATCEDEDAVQAVLTGMMLTLCELRDQYPEYIEVMEVQ